VTALPWLKGQWGRLGWRGIAGVHRRAVEPPTGLTDMAPFQRVAVALDFSGDDEKLLAETLRLIDKAHTEVVLLHVVESPVARTWGTEGEDWETLKDRERLTRLAELISSAGVKTWWLLNSGDPVEGLVKMIEDLEVDMVVVGSHGHSGVADLVHGTVINNLRHRIKARVMIVPLRD